MKTISTLLFAGMLMSALCVAFVACNEPTNTPPEWQEGVDVPFTEYSLGVPGEEFSANWVNLDYDDYVALFDGECKILIINSDDELKNMLKVMITRPSTSLKRRWFWCMQDGKMSTYSIPKDNIFVKLRNVVIML